MTSFSCQKPRQNSRRKPPAQTRALPKPIRCAASFAILAALLAGCAYTPPPLTIAPTLPAEVAAIERETALALSVSDARGGAAAGAAANGAVMAEIEAAVRELFARKGYRLVAADAPHDARLSVAVHTFDYRVASGRWSSGEEAEAVLTAEAVRGSSRRTSTYRSAGEREASFELYRRLPGATPSDVLSDILARIAVDAELQQFLTGN